ncbi:hypothetical protein [Dactylosporangium sp. NPDC051541]|uniref:hypothetical protein n=1 Tax=Dactylosporangium sp. NPDC051541 TaxID=3363977 RepID=UPI0037B7441B
MMHRAGPLTKFRLSGAGVRNNSGIKRRGRRGLFDLLLRLDGLRPDGFRSDGLRLDGLLRRPDGLRLDGLRLDGLRLDGLRLDGLRKPGRPGLEPLLLGHRHIVAIDPAELGGVALFKSLVALFPMHTAKRFHHRAVFPRPGPITHRRRFAFAE